MPFLRLGDEESRSDDPGNFSDAQLGALETHSECLLEAILAKIDSEFAASGVLRKQASGQNVAKAALLAAERTASQAERRLADQQHCDQQIAKVWSNGRIHHGTAISSSQANNSVTVTNSPHQRCGSCDRLCFKPEQGVDGNVYCLVCWRKWDDKEIAEKLAAPGASLTTPDAVGPITSIARQRVATTRRRTVSATCIQCGDSLSEFEFQLQEDGQRYCGLCLARWDARWGAPGTAPQAHPGKVA